MDVGKKKLVHEYDMGGLLLTGKEKKRVTWQWEMRRTCAGWEDWMAKSISDTE